MKKTKAASMVANGSAAIHNQNGKVKSVKLVETACTHLERIGEPGEGRATGVKFTRRVRSDDLAVTWCEHHPRARDYEGG
jgi:hypothetical protein